jgi:hypothetical protein
VTEKINGDTCRKDLSRTKTILEIVTQADSLYKARYYVWEATFFVAFCFQRGHAIVGGGGQ